MRKLYFLWVLAIFFAVSVVPEESYGQSKKGPPSWAPAHGYRAKTRHIYFPEQNVYYDLQKGVYISLSGNNWSVSAKLPSPLIGLNLSATAKVELDFQGDDPQKYNSDHKQKFKGKGPKNKPEKKQGKKK